MSGIPGNFKVSFAPPVGTGLNHGASNFITGSGMGTKSPAGPVIWDDCSGTNIDTLWTSHWPISITGGEMAYRPVQRGITMPHNRNGQKYMCGQHWPHASFLDGQDVMVWKQRTVSTFPQYTYMAAYTRSDDAWVFGDDSDSDHDNNYKIWQWCGNEGEPFGHDPWYIEYNGDQPSSKFHRPTFHINDDGLHTSGGPNDPYDTLDLSTGQWWGNDGAPPFAGNWLKHEFVIKISRTLLGGRIAVFENGSNRFDKVTRTDNMTGTLRADAIGGYLRVGDPNNWRYFKDIYLDYTWQRLMLCNTTSLSTATILEPQVCTAWTPTRIDHIVNLGRFTTPGVTAYLIVVDAANAQVGSGIPVIIGT